MTLNESFVVVAMTWILDRQFVDEMCELMAGGKKGKGADTKSSTGSQLRSACFVKSVRVNIYSMNFQSRHSIGCSNSNPNS